MTARPRPRTRRRYLPEDAPSAGEAEADLAEDEADRDWWEQYRAERGWGEK